MSNRQAGNVVRIIMSCRAVTHFIKHIFEHRWKSYMSCFLYLTWRTFRSSRIFFFEPKKTVELFSMDMQFVKWFLDGTAIMLTLVLVISTKYRRAGNLNTLSYENLEVLAHFIFLILNGLHVVFFFGSRVFRNFLNRDRCNRLFK